MACAEKAIRKIGGVIEADCVPLIANFNRTLFLNTTPCSHEPLISLSKSSVFSSSCGILTVLKYSLNFSLHQRSRVCASCALTRQKMKTSRRKHFRQLKCLCSSRQKMLWWFNLGVCRGSGHEAVGAGVGGFAVSRMLHAGQPAHRMEVGGHSTKDCRSYS